MVAALLALLLARNPEIDFTKRWIYLSTNLLVDKNVDDGLALIARARKAGYNGVLLSDSKFMRWDMLDERYARNVERFRKGVRDAKFELVVCVAPIGYSNDLLSRDPNLAEGLPVENAPFRVTDDRKLVPISDSTTLKNGGFEAATGDSPPGWDWVDQPGKTCFIDRSQNSEGQCSLRMDSPGRTNPESGNARANQKLKVKPFRNLHLAVDVKTQGFETPGNVNITILGKDGRSLQHRSLPVERTMAWKTIDVTFNTLDNTEVLLYLGVWGGKNGSIWWDNVRLEPAGLVNLVRRSGAPLKVTTKDGMPLKEGTDFDEARDPKMGNVQWSGDYDVWHTPPTWTVPTGSSLKPGDEVLVSYFHTALIYDGQASVCFAEPKVDEIVKWQVEQVKKHLSPDGYMLSHDEIRMGGWDASCLATKKAPGEMLADNVRKCAAICRKADPGKTVYTWSDMFDPFHNALDKGPYYLVKGDGPWKNSWLGLDKDIVILNWNMGASRKKAAEFFAGRGHRQILAGYYDGGGAPIPAWSADVPGGPLGVMYTTWGNNWKDLEDFAKQAGWSDPRPK
ncbi:MAG: hypothetical protein K1X67_02940 [Fimbriimonadaceae bacterium]|nr:hypothetical protein [Fimbriimonadaceae bacterium]